MNNVKNPFEKVGLPKGHSFPRLTYHAPTRTIIAHTKRLKSVLPIQRISFRNVRKKSYRPLGNFPPSMSIDSLAAHPRSPLLYFLTYNWREYPNGPVGGNWDALRSFNLKTHRTKIVARPEELFGPKSCQWVRLRELYSFSENGKLLFCKAAFHYGKVPIHCCLAQLNLASRKLVPISRLKATFA